MRKSSCLPKNYRNCKKTFKKDLAYGNINSHKKAGLHPLWRKYIAGKITVGIQSNPPTPSSLFRVNLFSVFSSGEVDDDECR